MKRNPADEALKAAWLAQNAPTLCPTLPAIGTGNPMTEELFQLIHEIGVVVMPNGGNVPHKFEAAKDASRASHRRFKKVGDRPFVRWR